MADRNARRRGGAGAWAEPVDKPEANAPPAVVAKRIAQEVRQLTTIGDEHGHVTRPGEVLILVRKRGVAFEAVIRALKEAGVPVAGADRLNLGEHIAVLDLVAAGRAALLGGRPDARLRAEIPPRRSFRRRPPAHCGAARRRNAG